MKIKTAHTYSSHYRSLTYGVLFITCLVSCEEFVQIEPPKTQLVSKMVYSSDATAIAAISALYASMINGSGFSGGGINSVTFLSAHSSDEMVYVSTNQDIQQIAQNNILTTNSLISTIWSSSYNIVYQANALAEGVANSHQISKDLKIQLEGEAKFIRAFCHFYLVNLFGDVPYITTTDYRINNIVNRTATAEVYVKIIEDLTYAQEVLSADYSLWNGERVRPNKWAAMALLSRVYLFTGEWAKAENIASGIIDNTSLFNLETLDHVFLKNSMEAIWQLKPIGQSYNTPEGNVFILTGPPQNSALTHDFADAVEEGDKRKLHWIGSVVANETTWYHPYKYKIRTGINPFNEYSMVLRLAEQYLIRAEALALQNKVVEAISDVDIIRARSGLPLIADANPVISKDELLLTIQKERKMELFCEWGHRWLDLKRTGRADQVLKPFKPGWTTTDILYPIPNSETLVNSHMVQNPGYN